MFGKLKDCKICGGKASEYDGDDVYGNMICIVKCSQCGRKTGWFGDKSKVRKVWNEWNK